MKLTLMFRPYCGLCHQMLEELKPFQAAYDLEIEVIHIDDFPEWEEKYNELVPVLLHNETEICHWHLNQAKLKEYLHSSLNKPQPN